MAIWGTAFCGEREDIRKAVVRLPLVQTEMVYPDASTDINCKSDTFGFPVLFSVGADSVLKAASSSSGKVISKVKLPSLKDST